MNFTIDRSRLANIVAQSDAARLALSKANDGLRTARAALREAEANAEEYRRRGQVSKAEEIEPFIAKLRDDFSAAQEAHSRQQSLSRAASGCARNCIDYAAHVGGIQL